MANYLINIILDRELTIRWRNEESEFFKTDIVIPQGDSLNANEFTLYLSNDLYEQNHKYRNEFRHISINLKNTQMVHPLSQKSLARLIFA